MYCLLSSCVTPMCHACLPVSDPNAPWHCLLACFLSDPNARCTLYITRPMFVFKKAEHAAALSTPPLLGSTPLIAFSFGHFPGAPPSRCTHAVTNRWPFRGGFLQHCLRLHAHATCRSCAGPANHSPDRHPGHHLFSCPAAPARPSRFDSVQAADTRCSAARPSGRRHAVQRLGGGPSPTPAKQTGNPAWLQGSSCCTTPCRPQGHSSCPHVDLQARDHGVTADRCLPQQGGTTPKARALAPGPRANTESHHPLQPDCTTISRSSASPRLPPVLDRADRHLLAMRLHRRLCLSGSEPD